MAAIETPKIIYFHITFASFLGLYPFSGLYCSLDVPQETMLHVVFFFPFLKKNYWKVIFTERRDREGDLASIDSPPLTHVAKTAGAVPIETRLQGPFRVSDMDAESQGFGLPSTDFPGHRQGAGWEAGPPGLELAPIWDPAVCKMRTVATSNTLKASLLKFTYLFQTLI